MSLSRRLTLTLSVYVVFLCQTLTTVQSQESFKEEILSLQSQLLVADGQSTAQQQNVLLSEAVAKEANGMREKFRQFGFPNDRLEKEEPLEKGDAVWFLLEIPQWWVTGTVWEVLDPSANLYRVHVTSQNLLHEAVRGVNIRGCRSEDYNHIWLSEYSRDLGEYARTENLPESQHERKRLYEVAMQLDPLNPHPIDNMGIYYLDHGNLEQGVAWYEKSLQVQPQWYHTYYNYGLLLRLHPHLLRHGEDTRVLDLFEKGFELNPLFLDGLWNVADQYAKHGRYAEECYSWRLLRELNANPSPYPEERPFSPWNPDWERFTSERIDECMNRLRQELDREQRDQEF